MKLRITVDGQAYDVDVDVLDDAGLITAPPPFAGAPAAKAPAKAAGKPAAPPPPPAPAPAPSVGGAKDCKAPIAGTVVQVKVKPGDAVAINQVIVIMEAMKMETNIASPVAGKVKAIRVKTGQAVKAGELLVEFE